MGRLPELPAVDIGAFLEFARVVNEGLCFLGGILQDCVRLPQLEVAVHESRENAVGIDLQILRSLMAAAHPID